MVFCSYGRSTADVDPFMMIGSMALLLIIIFAIIIISIIYKSFIDKKKKEREQKLLNIAQKTGDHVKPIFSKPLKDGATMECFTGLLDPTYINVVEKLDKEKGDIYIGELEWIKPVAPPNRKNSSYDYVAGAKMGTDSRYDRVKYYATMCVCYDNGFDLPNFDLTKETFNKKTAEFFKKNETEDIDFDEDKEFSDAWWLTSNDNMIVKQLFTYNIRRNFMKYVDKGYRISGQKNMLVIITDKVIQPENYSSIISDMKIISRVLRTNKKFYHPLEEEPSQTQTESTTENSTDNKDIPS